MGDVQIEIWAPFPPGLFALFLGIAVLYLIYVAAKFIISIWTGS